MRRVADLLEPRRLDDAPEQSAVLCWRQLSEVLMGRDQVVAQPEGHASVAGPSIAGGSVDEPGAHRVQLDVALAVLQVLPGLDDRGAVAPLPERAGASIQAVEVLHVSGAQALHHSRDGTRRRPRCENVHMVGHEDIRVHGDVVRGGGQLQATQEIEAIRILEEDVLAIVAAHHNVLGNAGDEETLEPGHGRSTARVAGGGQVLLEKLFACGVCAPTPPGRVAPRRPPSPTPNRLTPNRL